MNRLGRAILLVQSAPFEGREGDGVGGLYRFILDIELGYGFFYRSRSIE